MVRRATQRSGSRAQPANDESRKRKQTTAIPPEPELTSRYFESGTGHSDDEQELEDDNVSSFTEDGGAESDDVSSESSPEVEQPKRKRRTMATTGTTETVQANSSEGSQAWRPDVKTKLPLGTRIIIKKPKPRSAGDIPFADETIHPNTLLFLGELKANNDREWLKMHDPDYRTSLMDWNSFVEVLSNKLIELDDTIPELPLKDIVFRIYRDIRFSKDPTPYKPHFSAAWSRTGRKGIYAAYYIRVSPNDSFVGGGLWHPEAQALASVRRAIDENPQQLKDVLMEDRMRREFLNNAPKKADKVVQAFVASRSNAENALKRAPKGYAIEHPDINLLRLKSFTVGKKLADSEVLDAQILQRVTELFSAMHPFIACLNNAVFPDPSEDEAEDSDGGDEGEREGDDGEPETEATEASGG